MSREWVDDAKRPPRSGKPDTRDKRWVMRCDCWKDHGVDRRKGVVLLRCPTESEPSAEQPPLKQFVAAGWFIGELSNDRCPDCRAKGHVTDTTPHPLMGGAS